MIIDLEGQIAGIKDLDDAKAVLRQIVAAINQADDSKSYARKDLKFIDSEQGLVLQSEDGKFWRATLSGGGTSVDWDFNEVGKSV